MFLKIIKYNKLFNNNIFLYVKEVNQINYKNDNKNIMINDRIS